MIMDFEDYFNEQFDINAILFAESRKEQFEEFCLNRFQQRGVDRDE